MTVIQSGNIDQSLREESQTAHAKYFLFIKINSAEDGKWEARTSIEHGARVFDGIAAGTQRDFADDHADRSYLISELDDRQKPESGDIPHPPDYEGPHSCAGGEGCIPAGGAM